MSKEKLWVEWLVARKPQWESWISSFLGFVPPIGGIWGALPTADRRRRTVRRAAFWVAVAALLATMGALQVISALQESQTWDEGIYLAAGYSYWKTGDFRMNRDHPPLFKLLFSMPLLPLDPSLPARRQVWDSADQFNFGFLFMNQNRVPADTLLFLGRVLPILLTLVFGFVLVLWTRRKFGAAPAVLALFLFALDPNVIAHGRYVTADMMVTLFIFLAAVTWARFLETKRYRDLVMAAAMLSLALVSKFSALFLPPLLLLFYLFRWWQEGRGGRLSAKHFILSLIITAMICATTICVIYGPETMRSIYGPRLTSVVDRSTPVSAVLRWFGERLYLPAHPYLVGLHQQAVHDQGGHPAYLLGRQSPKGWWYYFPVVFAVKTPTAVLLLCTACLGLALFWLVRAGPLAALGGLRAIPPRWLVLTVTPAVYFLLCMRSHINIGIRHMLPVYPFLFVLLAAVLFHRRLDHFRVARAALLALVIAVLLTESVRIYPHYLAFFNTLAGGPGRGPEYLVDSNIDWGQDLKKLRKYLDSIGWKEPICVNYFGRASMTYYGLESQGLPATDDLTGRGQVDCIAAISVTALHDVYAGSTSYRWLRERTPMAKVGYSIYVYDLRKPRPYHSNRIRLLTPTPTPTCSYSVSTSALGVGASGGPVTLIIHTGANCPWNLSGLPNWLTVSGSAAGVGSAGITLVVRSNAGSSRTAFVSIGGTSVPVRQTDWLACGGSAACVTSVLPHLAFGSDWTTALFVTNSGIQESGFAVTFYGDDGARRALPFRDGRENLSRLSGTVPAQGAQYYEAANPAMPTTGGWGLVTADSSITVYALLRRAPSEGGFYEAGVTASSGYSGFLIPFDATAFAPANAHLYTGLAISNLNWSAPAHIVCVARDQAGTLIPNAVVVPTLDPLGHWANSLSPALVGKRGTLDCSADTLVSAIALRFIGTGAFSSLPVIVK